jgi:hypothetical protein
VAACGGGQQPASAPRSDPTSVKVAPASAPPRGAGFAEWQEYHRLNVRVLGYKRSALPKPNAKTRLDVITVDECAPAKHSLVVPHNHWVLVDSNNEIIGRAGAKVVHGKATEDIPKRLAAGACRRSDLVIAVPYFAIPVVVRDGTVATWTIPH